MMGSLNILFKNLKKDDDFLEDSFKLGFHYLHFHNAK